MSDQKSALLPNRGIIALKGPDAEKLLQGIITADMDKLGHEKTALHSGLLSPQGKILFDFFVVPHDDGYLIDTDKHQVPDLLKRLTMYKLRADVEISDASADYTAVAIWGEKAADLVGHIDCIAYVDPRLDALGIRLLMTLKNDAALRESDCDVSSEPAYDEFRIVLGVPEAGKDFPLADTFPHEALYDQLGSVSFTKGCFVGQEVVSRMQHRGTTRKRVVPVASANCPLPQSGSEVRGGASLIGTLGTVSGTRALGLLRLDRAAQALNKGDKLQAGEVAVEIELPSWATFQLPDSNAESKT